MATTDFSTMSDDELFAGLPPRQPASTASSTASSPAAAIAAPSAASTNVAAPAEQDYSKMSDDELFAGLPPKKPQTSVMDSVGAGIAGMARGAKDVLDTGAKALATGFDKLTGSNEGARVEALNQGGRQQFDTQYKDSFAAGAGRKLVADIPRQVGLTARAAGNAAAALPAMAADAVAAPINAGLDAVAGQGNGFRFPNQAQALNTAMDTAGVPKPENAQERLVQDVVGGTAAAATGVGIGGALAKSAGPLSRALGAMLSASPGMQAASGAVSGAASGLTREGGGGEVAQGIAGVAGALAPSVLPFAAKAAARGAIRGGEVGRQAMVDNIQTFEAASGSVPTLGQAMGSRGIQATETALTNTIGGSGIMVRRGERQAEELADSVKSLASALSPNASGADAGESIARGMNAFKDSMKSSQKHIYAELDRYIPDATPIGVTNTQQALAGLNEAIPGAPNISAFFRNAKLTSIDRALLADLDAASIAQAPAGMSSVGLGKMPGQLPYEAIKKLRTLVGAEISNNSLVADVPRSKWRAVYAALSQDLGEAAQQAGPRAEQLWGRANTVTRLSMERMDQLDGIVSRDVPEKVFSAATSGMGEGGTTITRIMKSLPVENRRDVAAAVLQRMGRARASAQDAMAEKFSSETFLTNLAGMSPPARRALFGSSGYPGLEEKVKQMGLMSSIRRDGSTVFANPSGTARQAGLIAWWASLAASLSTGNVGTASALLVGAGGANVVAKAVTSPRIVKALAEKTVLNPAVSPSALAATGRALSGDSSNRDERVFKNRLQAGQAARQAGGVVVPVPGGFAVRPQ